MPLLELQQSKKMVCFQVLMKKLASKVRKFGKLIAVMIKHVTKLKMAVNFTVIVFVGPAVALRIVKTLICAKDTLKKHWIV